MSPTKPSTKSPSYQKGESLLEVGGDRDEARMTLRDTLASRAPDPPLFWKVRTPMDVARWAYTWADAMLAVRDEATAPETADQAWLRR